jgi:hypothetical protein
MNTSGVAELWQAAERGEVGLFRGEFRPYFKPDPRHNSGEGDKGRRPRSAPTPPYMEATQARLGRWNRL